MAKFGGFRLGVGMRMTKKNAFLFFFVMLFVYIFKLMWYMMLLVGWLIYAMLYGMYWCIKKIARCISNKVKQRQP
jgi:hypothetical protein